MKPPPLRRCGLVFHGHYTSNWSAGGVERRENWISGNSFTTRAQRTAETQHQNAVGSSGEGWFHIHTEAFFIRSLTSPLSRAFIDTVCYQYLTQQAGKFNTDPKTYRRFLIQNKQKKLQATHTFFFQALGFYRCRNKFFQNVAERWWAGGNGGWGWVGQTDVIICAYTARVK